MSILFWPKKSFKDKLNAVFNIKRTKAQGFTLIELLVVFSLAATVSGIGFASLVSYSRQQALTQSGNDLRQAFNQARFNSISAVKPSSCPENSALSSYQLVICSETTCITGNADYEVVAVCGTNKVVTKSVKLVQNININPESTTCSKTEYSALSGSVNGANCNVAIQGYGNQGLVTVDSSGNASF